MFPQQQQQQDLLPMPQLGGFFPSSFVMSNWNVSNMMIMGNNNNTYTSGENSVNSEATLSSTSVDIILGRGTLHAKHPGNVRFYHLVDTFLDKYNAAETKMEKTAIIHEIYEKVLATGQRFVKQEPPSAMCEVVAEGEAKKKIGHTMRYRQKLQRAKRKHSNHAANASSSNATVTSTTTAASAGDSDAFSRSTSLQSLVTEADKVNLTKPLKAPPRLVKFPFSSGTTAATRPAAPMTKSPWRGIFSDEELETVLGLSPDKPASSSCTQDNTTTTTTTTTSAPVKEYLDIENWNQFDEEMDFSSVPCLSF